MSDSILGIASNDKIDILSNVSWRARTEGWANVHRNQPDRDGSFPSTRCTPLDPALDLQSLSDSIHNAIKPGHTNLLHSIVDLFGLGARDTLRQIIIVLQANQLSLPQLDTKAVARLDVV